MSNPPDLNKQIRARAAQLLGGEAEFQRLAEEESGEATRRWQQDTDTIGRILRAHLFIERFVTENLQRTNPALGSVEKAKLTFAQKMSLLNSANPDIADALPGIRRMNSIRNRLAHESHSGVTKDDAAALLQCRLFSQTLRMRHGEQVAALSPIDILEQFAKHTSIALTVGHSRLIAAVAEAAKELSPRDDA